MVHAKMVLCGQEYLHWCHLEDSEDNSAHFFLKQCQIVPISNDGISKICRFHDHIARTFWALHRPCLSYPFCLLSINLSILRFTLWWSKSPQVVAYKSFLFENSDAYYSYQTCGSSNECLNVFFRNISWGR